MNEGLWLGIAGLAGGLAMTVIGNFWADKRNKAQWEREDKVRRGERTRAERLGYLGIVEEYLTLLEETVSAVAFADDLGAYLRNSRASLVGRSSVARSHFTALEPSEAAVHEFEAVRNRANELLAKAQAGDQGVARRKIRSLTDATARLRTHVLAMRTGES